ncbi:unnamed protein product [Effrenium voratum]|uniref:Uncharacterized protein n=1 Tax=Effrenium voratum TaxID=2562239 RepID=A0AA36J1Z6_9DINO|nr:unnamed protein product [Effrenium voratum]
MASLSVRVSLHTFFYQQSGRVFNVDVTPQMTLMEVGTSAIEKMGAWSNQTEHQSFQKFEVHYKGKFHLVDGKLSDLDDINGVFHVVAVKGFYGETMKKKQDDKDGFYPVYPTLTIKQMKGVIEEMAHGDPCGSPIMRRSEWVPTPDDFALPPRAMDVEIDAISDHEESEDTSDHEDDSSSRGTVAEPDPEDDVGLVDFIDFGELADDMPCYDIDDDNKFSQGYLKDASDFQSVHPLPILLHIKEPKAGKLLFSLKVSDQNIAIADVKLLICQKIAKMPNADRKRSLGVDAFVLAYGEMTCADASILSDISSGQSEIDLVVLLRLRGGVKSVMSSITKPVKKSDLYMEKAKGVFKKIENQTYESETLKDAQGFSKYINQNVEHGGQIFKTAVSAMNSDAVKEALKIISANGRNFGSTEQKIEKVSAIMCGKMMRRLEEEEQKIRDVRNSIICGMISAYTCWCFKSGKYDNTDMKKMLKEQLRKLGVADGEIEDSEMSALTEMLSKSSV